MHDPEKKEGPRSEFSSREKDAVVPEEHAEKKEEENVRAEIGKVIARLRETRGTIARLRIEANNLRYEIDVLERANSETKKSQGYEKKMQQFDEIRKRISSSEAQLPRFIEVSEYLHTRYSSISSSLIDRVAAGRVLTAKELDRMFWYPIEEGREYSMPKAEEGVVVRSLQKNGTYLYERVEKDNARTMLETKESQEKKLLAEKEASETKDLLSIMRGDREKWQSRIEVLLRDPAKKEEVLHYANVSQSEEADAEDLRWPFQAVVLQQLATRHADPEVANIFFAYFTQESYNPLVDRAFVIATLKKSMESPTGRSVHVANALRDLATTRRRDALDEEALDILAAGGESFEALLDRCIVKCERREISTLEKERLMHMLYNMPEKEDKEADVRLKKLLSTTKDKSMRDLLVARACRVDPIFMGDLNVDVLKEMCMAHTGTKFAALKILAQRKEPETAKHVVDVFKSMSPLDLQSPFFADLMPECVDVIKALPGLDTNAIAQEWLRLMGGANHQEEALVLVRGIVRIGRIASLPLPIREAVENKDDEALMLALHDYRQSTVNEVRLLPANAVFFRAAEKLDPPRKIAKHEAEIERLRSDAVRRSAEALHFSIVDGKFPNAEALSGVVHAILLTSERNSDFLHLSVLRTFGRDDNFGRLFVALRDGFAKALVDQGYKDLASINAASGRMAMDVLDIVARALASIQSHGMCVTLLQKDPEEFERLLVVMREKHLSSIEDVLFLEEFKQRFAFIRIRRSDFTYSTTPPSPPVERKSTAKTSFAPTIVSTSAPVPDSKSIPVPAPVPGASPVAVAPAPSPSKKEEAPLVSLMKESTVSENSDHVQTVEGTVGGYTILVTGDAAFVKDKSGTLLPLAAPTVAGLNAAVLRREEENVWQDGEEKPVDPYQGHRTDMMRSTFAVGDEVEVINRKKAKLIAESMHVLYRNAAEILGKDIRPLHALGLVHEDETFDEDRAKQFADLFMNHLEEIRSWTFADIQALRRLWDREGRYEFASLARLHDEKLYS